MQSSKDIVHEQTVFDQVAILIKDEKNAEAKSILQASNLHQITSTPEKLTLLHIAAEVGNKDMTQHLIELGSNVEAETAAGLTPLTLAVENKRRSVVEILLFQGNCKYDYINAKSKFCKIDDTKSDESRIYHMIVTQEIMDWTKTSEFQSTIDNLKEFFK